MECSDCGEDHSEGKDEGCVARVMRIMVRARIRECSEGEDCVARVMRITVRVRMRVV